MKQKKHLLATRLLLSLLALLTASTAWADDDLSTYVVISEKPTVTMGQGTNWGSSEDYGMLVDGKLTTKYGLSNADPYVEFNYAAPITPKAYALWTANDQEGARNPKSWTILAKNEGDTDWTTLASVDNSNGNKLPMANDTETRFALSKTNAYQYFRFEATRKGEFQLAELQFLTTDDDLAATVVSGIDKYYIYTGSAFSITPVVTKQDKDKTTLTLGTDFTAKLNGNTVSSFPMSVTDKGTYTLLLTGTGSYTGTHAVTFSVLGNEDLTLLEDEEFGANEDGHYYVNMRAVGPATLTLSDATITTFKVYDDGGRKNSYSDNCNSTLTITAPEGYALQLSGYVMVDPGDESKYEAPRRKSSWGDETPGNDYLIVYDGTTTSDPRLGKEKYGLGIIQQLYSTGRSMTLHFQSDDVNNSRDGLDLTVKLISTTTEYDITVESGLQNGTITAYVGGTAVNKAKLNDKVTLVITPEEGYRLGRLNVYDQTNKYPVTVADDNTFLMPAGDVTIPASFLPAVTTTYIDEKGVSQTVLATPIESSDEDCQIHAPGFYTVRGNQTIQGTVSLDSGKENVSLILEDDATLSCTVISGYQCPLTIYGQSKGNGKLITNKDGDTSFGAMSYKQYGGDVSLKNINSYGSALHVQDELLIAGGTLTATSTGNDATAISGKDITIRGGQVKATVVSDNDRIAINAYNSLTLGCSSVTDFIQINGRIAKHDDLTVSIAKGQTLTDGTNTYTGKLSEDEIDNLKGQTLTDFNSGTCGTTGSESSVTWKYDSSTKTLAISGTGAMMYYGSALGSDSKYHSTAPWSKFDSEIEAVTVGENVTYLGSYAFAYCGELTTVSLPSTLMQLGDAVFFTCTGLTTVSLPSAVSSIGANVFNYCNQLAQVVLARTEPVTIGDNAFDNCATGLEILVPAIVKGYYTTYTEKLKAYATVTVSAGTNGTVAVDEDKTTALTIGSDKFYVEGHDVVLAVTPETGYSIGTVKYNETAIEPSAGVYAFAMPAYSVTASATFNPAAVKITNGVGDVITSDDEITVPTLDYTRDLAAPADAASADAVIDETPVNVYTLCLPYAPATEAGIKYYTLSGSTTTALQFKEIEDDPAANTPYLVTVSAATSVGLASTMADVTLKKNAGNSVVAGDFQFVGTTTGLTNDEAAVAGAYILQSQNKWGKVNAGNAGVYIPPFRAYVVAKDESTARLMDTEFSDGSTTGIQHLQLIDKDGTEQWFDLSGRRISKPTSKGVYIQNGRKVLLVP